MTAAVLLSAKEADIGVMSKSTHNGHWRPSRLVPFLEIVKASETHAGTSIKNDEKSLGK